MNAVKEVLKNMNGHVPPPPKAAVQVVIHHNGEITTNFTGQNLAELIGALEIAKSQLMAQVTRKPDSPIEVAPPGTRF